MSGIVARRQRVRAIFESVHELPPHTRAATVATACGDDSALRRDGLDLIEAAEGMGSFLQHGVARVVAPDARPGDRIGPYEVARLLASGGMGDAARTPYKRKACRDWLNDSAGARRAEKAY